MALLHNTVIQSATLGRRMGATEGILPLAGLSRMERKNWHCGEHAPDKKAGVADGNRPPATWSMALAAGGMSSRNFAGLSVTTTASGALGLPAEGSASFTIDFAPATGGLIVSGSGTASFAITTTAEVRAALSGSGSASFTISTNTPQLGALGWASGSGAFSVSATLQSYAVGYMQGSTVDNTTLTADAIVAALRAASINDPLWVDVRKVFGTQVQGSGTAVDPWGP